jgi:hypothetical protein
MATPTETAESYFRMAAMRFRENTKTTSGLEYSMAMGELDMANGMLNLCVGIRATYLLLQEVKGLLNVPGPPGPHRVQEVWRPR